ncbi:sulfotransferase family protein [uncultured Winogradskyella sp.]|uniref:sulfotransferase-like domain-containing protein n=1 Tax=uncultured Winogradskyella sp. TaxID=395353 RepID=UPI002633D796|nr:sulfotransferase family protein [uncultured Winogradskyella sp.]
MDNFKRICLWSGPRNISTALMYSFAQRKDTNVFDEPLYAFYLKQHPEAHSYHPGAKQILATMENDGNKVVSEMMGNTEKPVQFYKHMTHHLLNLDRTFMKDTINIMLTRDPKDMLPSFDKVIPNPSLDDVGYALHVELINYFKDNDIQFTVLDSKKVLDNPKKILTKLCNFIEIPFEEAMLNWQPQQRVEDGIWAKYWYENVHKSSGFQKYKPKEEPFPTHLKQLLETSKTYYNELVKYAIS